MNKQTEPTFSHQILLKSDYTQQRIPVNQPLPKQQVPPGGHSQLSGKTATALVKFPFSLSSQKLHTSHSSSSVLMQQTSKLHFSNHYPTQKPKQLLAQPLHSGTAHFNNRNSPWKNKVCSPPAHSPGIHMMQERYCIKICQKLGTNYPQFALKYSGITGK